MGKKIVVFALLVLITGCTTTTVKPAVNDPRRVWCDTNEPRRDATDETPRSVIDEINTHNRRGAMWCGWKP